MFGITGLECEYPSLKYTTDHMFDLFGNKLSETVKDNIKNLGVEERYFIRPLEQYLLSDYKQIKSIEDGEPITDLCISVAKKCLSKLGLVPNDITCLVAASEDNDFLSPGLASVLVSKTGLSNFIPHYNIQGMACSSLPKVLELSKNLVHDENDKVLVVISGCNSGWYLPHLRDNMNIKNPNEISENQYDKNKQIRKWVSTMFSFLFGDGACAFVLSNMNENQTGVKIGKITHGVNFDTNDYRLACVRLVGDTSSHFYSHELSAHSGILDRTLNYSKKVLMRSLGYENMDFDSVLATTYMANQKKIMIHTGSLKILNGLQKLYKLKDDQSNESYHTLKHYGNLTGVSIPTVMDKAFFRNSSVKGKGLLIGITMGFGLDLVEVEKI